MYKIFFCFYLILPISLFAQKLNNDTLIIKSLCDSAFVVEDSVSAFALLEQAKLLGEKLSDKKWLAQNAVVEANLYYLYNNSNKAIEVSGLAEVLCEKYFPKKLSLVLLNKGIFYYSLGNYNKAIFFYHESLKVAEVQKDNHAMARCYDQIGSDSYEGVDMTDADFKKANGYMLKAISIYEKEKDWTLMASTYINLGIQYQEYGKIDEAKNALRKVLEITEKKKEAFKETQDIVTAAYAYNNLAFIELNFGKNYKLVEEYARKAIPKLIKYKHLGVLSMAYLNMGIANIHTSTLDKATVYLDSSMAISLDTKNPRHIMLNWKGRYQLDSAKGNTAASLQAIQNYIQIKDSLYSADNITTIKKLNLQFETEKKDIEIVEQKKQLKQQRWLIGLASLLSFMGVLVGYFVYRSKKLNQKLFTQREKSLLLEKALEQDEKEKSLLREKLKIEENLRLQNEVDFKHKELATVTLNIQQKNCLLEELREHLYNLSEKQDTDKEEAIKNMRRSIKSNINFDNDWDKVKVHFENVHTGFFEKLSSLAPLLTPNELKQCAYIKINMNPKEVGNLLGIDAQSVRMSRYRIKKKIGMPEDKDLSEFILSL